MWRHVSHGCESSKGRQPAKYCKNGSNGRRKQTRNCDKDKNKTSSMKPDTKRTIIWPHIYFFGGTPTDKAIMQWIRTVFLVAGDESSTMSGTRPTINDFMNLPTYTLCGWNAYHASYTRTSHALSYMGSQRTCCLYTPSTKRSLASC